MNVLHTSIAAVAVVYICYVSAHVLTGQPPPDGVLLATVIGSITGITGYRIGRKTHPVNRWTRLPPPP